jgi:DNA polymerase
MTANEYPGAEPFLPEGTPGLAAARRGKRRIHQRPDTWQVRSCGPWLSAEIERVKPRVIMALGSIAGQALCVATIHPSAVLRAPDRDSAYRGLVDDLKVAANVLSATAGTS